MIALRFILWPVLLICVLWAGAIFLGPALIVNATSYFSEGRVNLTRVEVSPKLKISAAVVDFVLPELIDGVELDGVSRALTIDWKIGKEFELIGNIGPSTLSKNVNLSSINFTLKPNSMLDWSKVNFQIEFEQLVGADFKLTRGNFSGKVIETFHVLKDVEMAILKVRGKMMSSLFESTSLTATLDHYKVNQPLRRQNSELTYKFDNFAFPVSTFESSLFEGDIKISDGVVVASASITDAQIKSQNLKAKSLRLLTTHSLPYSASKGLWEFTISEIEREDPLMKISSYIGQLAPSPSGIFHSGRAIISRLDLQNDKFFVGQVENGVLDVKLSSRVSPSRTDVLGQAVLTLGGVDDFSVSASIKSAMPKIELMNCFDQECRLRDLEVDYQILASGSSLIGSLRCEEADCYNPSAHHELQTDNTNRFFQALSGFGILSPLSLPIAFMAISSGEAVGNGHKLKF